MKWFTKKAEDEFEDEKFEIIEALEEANDLIFKAVDSLKFAADQIKGSKIPIEYDIVGNMKGYVLGHLVNTPDCITEKIEGYIKDVEGAGILTEEQKEEREDDIQSDIRVMKEEGKSDNAIIDDIVVAYKMTEEEAKDSMEIYNEENN